MDRYHSKKISEFAKTRRVKRVARLYPKTEPISEPSLELELILKYPFGCFVNALQKPPSAENMASLRRAARAMWVRPSCPKYANDDFGIFRNWSLRILTRCIEKNRLDALRMLVLEENVNVNASNSTGWTALHAASLAGMTDMVAFLVANGSLLEIIGTQHRVLDIPVTPLFAAALDDRVITFKFLLEAGAKVALSSADFPSAINYTFSPEIVAMALSHGAGVNVDSKEANKPTDCINGTVQAPLLVFPERGCLVSAARAAQFFIDQLMSTLRIGKVRPHSKNIVAYLRIASCSSEREQKATSIIAHLVQRGHS